MDSFPVDGGRTCLSFLGTQGEEWEGIGELEALKCS